MRQGLARLARPLAFAAALGLAACGGGTSPVNAFLPSRMISFGDEYSVFEFDGSRYTINSLTATGAVDCSISPTWVQYLAAQFGMAFSDCNPQGLPEANATSFAQAGAKVDDFAAQVESYVASGGTFDGQTLATVLVGGNDVLEQYVLYETEGEAALLAELRVRGIRWGDAINRIVNAGGKVIVAEAPDVGRSPFALQEQVTHTDTDRAALMSRMTDALNTAMVVTIINDGRLIGLVQTNDTVRAASRFPGSFGLTNSFSAACTTALPACTTSTLVVDATNANYMWADDTRLGPALQLRIGQLATDRAKNNPF